MACNCYQMRVSKVASMQQTISQISSNHKFLIQNSLLHLPIRFKNKNKSKSKMKWKRKKIHGRTLIKGQYLMLIENSMINLARVDRKVWNKLIQMWSNNNSSIKIASSNNKKQIPFKEVKTTQAMAKTLIIMVKWLSSRVKKSLSSQYTSKSKIQ